MSSNLGFLKAPLRRIHSFYIIPSRPSTESGMLQLSKGVLALSVTASLAARACGASIFAFDTYSSWENLDTPAISDMTAKRLLELRMEAPMSTLGNVDSDTVELLNEFGGSPTPLFSRPSYGLDESTKTLLIVQGVDSQVGMFNILIDPVGKSNRWTGLTTNMQFSFLYPR